MHTIPHSGDEIARRARAEWHRLTREEQIDAVHRLADDGMTDYGIAAATHLAVEMVRAILDTRRQRA